jgi:hypothetical protein
MAGAADRLFDEAAAQDTGGGELGHLIPAADPMRCDGAGKNEEEPKNPARRYGGWRRPISKKSLRKQANRAETIADQTVDDQLKETLTEAAKEYRGMQSGPRSLIARGAAATSRQRLLKE